MADDTGIQWTDATWNPVRGCSRVSKGCDNCYAIPTAHRFAGTGGAYDGLTVIRNGRTDWAGHARFVPTMLDQPLRWTKPRRIFVNSMSDLFHHTISNEEIAAVFGVMAAAPQHTFQILTKRPERMKAWFEWAREQGVGRAGDLGGEAGALLPHVALNGGPVFHDGYKLVHTASKWPLANVWLGVTAEDQEAADKRIPLLLETPAAVRFVSAEPLICSINLAKYVEARKSIHMSVDAEGALRNGWAEDVVVDGARVGAAEGRSLLEQAIASGVRRLSMGHCDAHSDQTGCPGHPEPRLDWVIVGGESGPGARPCHVEWIESIARQCLAAKVACFVKQLGSVALVNAWRGAYFEWRTIKPEEERFADHESGMWRVRTKQKKGADPLEWSEELHLRVRQFPGNAL